MFLTLLSCSLWHAVLLLLTLETIFWNLWMPLACYFPQNQFCMLCIPFFDWYLILIGKYYTFYIIKVKIFDLYQVKAFLLLVLFHWQGLIILSDIMNWLTTSGWSLFHLLPLHWPAHCLEVVGLPVFSICLAICRKLSLWVLNPTQFAIFYSFLLSLGPHCHFFVCYVLQC